MTVDDVKRILVVGAGQMGAQIAMQSALSGYECTLSDTTTDTRIVLAASRRVDIDGARRLTHAARHERVARGGRVLPRGIAREHCPH